MEKITFWQDGKLETITIKNVDEEKPFESVKIEAELRGLSGFYWCGLYCLII